MRCPCCDSEVEEELLVMGGELWLDSGRVIEGAPGVMELLKDLLRHGSIPMVSRTEANSNVLNVQVGRLRDLLRREGLPLSVETRKSDRRYVLRRLPR